MVPYEKKCESPKFYNKQDLPYGYGTFLVGHEKTYRNAINLDIRYETWIQYVKSNLNKMIEHLTKVKNILMIPKAYLKDKINTILR